MMNDNIAIKVENLSKVYKLYNAPIDRLKESLNPFKKSYHKEFYALNDVSFEIKKGECVGILGKNGAGKSTILKIITGVLTPTSGSVTINGRISALLELGAGFNPEYTGIENIYFQGNIMGFSREEMDNKIQDILDFAEIGDFIDQPVKNYSSGMFARLAFAVAINVDPDILIVDEALSVGDIRFQQKCVRKMRSLMEHGVTIIFVSHDTGAIVNFCTKAIFLNDGKLQMFGDVKSVVDSYVILMNYGLNITASESQVDAPNNNSNYPNGGDWIRVLNKDYFGTADCDLEYMLIKNGSLFKGDYFYPGEELTLYFKINSSINVPIPGISFALRDRLGNFIFGANNYMYKKQVAEILPSKSYIAKFKFIIPNIKCQLYTLTFALSNGTQENHEQIRWYDNVCSINLISSELYNRIGLYYVLPEPDINISLVEYSDE